MLSNKYHEENDKKIVMKFDIDTLDMIVIYLFQNTSQITRGHLMNLRKLFTSLDLRSFGRNQVLKSYYDLIMKTLQAKIDMNMSNPSIILNFCKDGKLDENTINEIANKIETTTFGGDEIKWVNKMISERLTYTYLYKNSAELAEHIERLEDGDYDSLEQMNASFREVIGSMMNDIRKTESSNVSDQKFSLSEEAFSTTVSSVVTKLRLPSNKLTMGSQKLNEIMSGGPENGRVYLFLGLSGGFKSGILLTMAMWMKKFNQNFKTIDPKKRPAVLFITQENDLFDTVERLFNMTVTNDDIRNYTPEEAVRLMREKGELRITTEDNIDLVVQYYPNKAICTSDIYNIISDLEDDNIEVIALIHDYVKRIRSATPQSELRLELGEVINEFKVIAQQKSIPVITASQLNRDASRVIDAGVEGNKSDLARMLGSSNIGESWGMIENCDWVSIINREDHPLTAQTFLTFKRIKIRFKEISKLSYFNHPFDTTNTIKLIEDMGGECMSVESLSPGMDDINNDKSRRKTAQKRREVTLEDEEYRGASQMEELLGMKKK